MTNMFIIIPNLYVRHSMQCVVDEKCEDLLAMGSHSEIWQQLHL